VAEPVPGIATISIDDFTRVELRAGEIKTAERVPKADKLLRMTIDLGEATPRQILAGIAQYYDPEALIGRKVIVVANLAPRKLRGLESQACASPPRSERKGVHPRRLSGRGPERGTASARLC
jgi:methionyl-tRNA synthetase